MPEEYVFHKHIKLNDWLREVLKWEWSASMYIGSIKHSLRLKKFDFKYITLL